jgi:hypothetical protein
LSPGIEEVKILNDDDKIIEVKNVRLERLE